MTHFQTTAVKHLPLQTETMTTQCVAALITLDLDTEK